MFGLGHVCVNRSGFSLRCQYVEDRPGGLDVGAVDGGAFDGRERSGVEGELIAEPEEEVALVNTLCSGRQRL